MDETPGARLYQIRLACGDGVRKPESLRAFAERVFAATKRRYDPMAISLLERMEQGWKLDDVSALSVVDPLGRGAVWLSALSSPAGIETLDPSKDRKLTMQEIQRARAAVARDDKAAPQTPKKVARKPGRGAG